MMTPFCKMTRSPITQDSRRGSNSRRWMNPGRVFGRLVEQRNGVRKRKISILRAQHRQGRSAGRAPEGGAFPQQDGRRAGGLDQGAVFGIRKKSQLTRLR